MGAAIALYVTVVLCGPVAGGRVPSGIKVMATLNGYSPYGYSPYGRHKVTRGYGPYGRHKVLAETSLR